MSSTGKRKAFANAPFKKPRTVAYGNTAKMGGGHFVGSRKLSSVMEQKDVTQNNSPVVVVGTTTGTLFLLNGLVPGTSATTRDGRRVTMSSLYLKGHIQVAGTGEVGSASVRVLVVYDKQSNAAAPAATDVLLADTINSPNNLSNSRRFKTLLDEEIPCVGAGGPQSVLFERYVKLGLNTEFNTGNAGTIADITTGAVYMIVWAFDDLVNAYHHASIYSRIRFLDA